MGMFNPKKRKIITAVIAVILVLAMVDSKYPVHSCLTEETIHETWTESNGSIKS